MPQAPRTSTPTEVLAGLVDRVTFHNSENGFCVLRVKARGQRFSGRTAVPGQRAPTPKVRFAADSLLEEAGFELVVPL